MIWTVTGFVAGVAVLVLLVWAALGAETVLPLLLAVPFILLIRASWTRRRAPGAVARDE